MNAFVVPPLVRSVFLLSMALVALALAFRLAVDGINQIGNDRTTDRTTIPTVYVPDPDRGMTSLNPRPRLLRDA